MFNNILDRKETFFGNKNFIPLKSHKSHFSKGLTHGLAKTSFFVSLFVVGQNKARNNVLDRKQTLAKTMD